MPLADTKSSPGSGPASEPHAAAAHWSDVLYQWRDRVFGSPRFQSWAARFPLTRPIANRHARAAFDLCAGFVYSQVLSACIELRLLERLASGPRTAADLAQFASLPQSSMDRLLSAAAALDLVSRRPGARWGLGVNGVAVLSSPGLAGMIRHHAHFYADLRDPVALLRGEKPGAALSAFWPYAGDENAEKIDASRISDYSELMAKSQGMIAQDILRAWPMVGHRKLLDVGGGLGAFASAAVAAHPHLSVTVFDLPAVVALAQRSLHSTPHGKQISVEGGDFFRESLPRGADIVTLVRIIHDHNDDDVLVLLRNIRAALPEGGHLLIAEPMSGVPGAERISDAYFGLYLLAMGSGRARRPDEIGALLRVAGFRASRQLHTPRPLLVSAVLATA